MDLQKAIVIGATSGIGKELARILAHNHYIVGITGRRLHLLEELKQELPDKFFVKQMDISKPDESIALLAELIDEMKGMDLIIINSGTGSINRDLDFTIEKATIDVNVIGFTAIANTAMKHFIKQKSGHLVAISSIAALRGLSLSYSASKAFMSNYMESLRIKIAHMKIPIITTDIQPGYVDTAMAQGEHKFWQASPEKAAQQIFQAIRKKKTHAYITKRWHLIAWLLKIIPNFLIDRI